MNELPIDQRITPKRWFGEFELGVDQTLHLSAGPMSLWVHRSAMEWRLFRESVGDPYETRTDVLLRQETQVELANNKIQRFVMAGRSPLLTLGLLLPDRPMVSRPVSPVSIPPNESVCFYLSYPLWVSVAVGKPATKLTEFPSYQLSDTWFGPNTRQGTLCYATKSRCRLSLAEHSNVPTRAITPLLIRNLGKDALTLEKVLLPVATLSLFRAADSGLLWTQAVTMVRQQDGETADLKLGAGAPPEAGPAEQVAGPREIPQRNAMVRAFSALF